MHWYNTWEDVTASDIEKVGKLLQRGNLSVVSGGILAKFEKNFANWAGTRYAVAFSSGTASLYAALWAVGVRADHDVLICDYSFHAMAASVLALGARVIPVDCYSDSLTLQVEDLANCLTKQSKGILVHNPWGVPADLEGIRAACNLPIISDASHAHGATYKGKPIAQWADITCFSLGKGKLITGGELGCAVTDDPILRDRLLILGHINRVPQDLLAIPWGGNAVGLKFRPHPVALSLANSQLERFQEKLHRLRKTCSELVEKLAPLGLIPQATPTESERVYWRLVFHLDETRFASVTTETIEEALRKKGIPVEPNHYWPQLQNQLIFSWPDHQQKILRRSCPVANQFIPRTITLPAPVILCDEIMEQVLKAVKEL